MIKQKDVLTTGQVAQICNVAPRTVTKWFDSGQLRGYRIPGSRDRRIPTAELLRFMKAHNMPTNMVEMGKPRILFIDADESTSMAMANWLSERTGYEVQVANSSFDAGVIAQKFEPHVILINLMSNGIDAIQICKNIKSYCELERTKVIAISERLSEAETTALLKKGFDGFLPKNAEINEVIRIIEDVSSSFS